ncbi:hypothetical protein GOP47_0019021 [Adiantum capillus-veneris]|uniref:E3 ubiquitin ligase PQT3-like n=1 Tax=Adiantum capillus-veneris TaxID=13818 RepID=A0A9D4ZA55_ADICA|nr:hypothetical protein GOP47_0019021 [Adiantum capillus-veneris]
MAVHFKFRSAVAFDSIRVEGTGITIANLKEKIVEQKNLGRSTNFDLVITNAESGEEYVEDTFVVPKNTSVIIKRIPARRARTLLLVNEPEDNALEQPPPKSINKVTDLSQLALTSPIDELYDMDDFGVDLYAVDESALTHVEADETSIASAFMSKTLTDEKRYIQENVIAHGYGKDASAKGLARGLSCRAVPHAGYVCHRCGLPGHFIQHCPTNGDPAYDFKKGSRLRADWEGLSASPTAVSQPNNFVVKEVDPLPPELRCSLCEGILKEAVMVPCCQYSFCDTCARQYFLEKGSCPQCGSDKLKKGDLLPNVALRQAIERFTSAQPDTTVPNEGADVELATKVAKVLSSPTQLQKMSSSAKDLISMVVVGNQPELPVVDDSVCESAIGSKEKVIHEGSITVASIGEASSAGKKKKRPFARPSAISEMVSEHMTGKFRKGNKYCFVCGSPDHIARNCTANAGDHTTCFPTQRGVFRPLGPLPSRGMNSFGQEMFWPGAMPYCAPALPVGPYGPMPYGAPALPVAPYGVSSFTPSMYPNPQMHGFLNGAPGRMVAPRERPLSREEFMELQERERRRRLTQERQDRELSEERPLSGAGSEQYLSSGSEQSFHKQWPAANKLQGSFRSHDVDFDFPKEVGSSKSKQKHNRKYASERVDEHTTPQQYDYQSDDSRGPILQRVQQGIKPVQSVTKKAKKLHDFSAYVDHEEGKLNKQITLGLFDGAPFEEHEHKSYVKHDGTRVSEAGAAEMLRAIRHRSKKVALEGSRMLYSGQSMEISSEAKDRHTHHGLLSDDGSSFEVLKNTSVWKHQNEAKLEIIDSVSVEGMKKRKHKKRKVEGSKVLPVENVVTEWSMHRKSSKRHKSRHTSLLVDETSVELPSALDDIEESRWQMYDGLEDAGNPQKERCKRKRHRSSKSTLQKE